MIKLVKQNNTEKEEKQETEPCQMANFRYGKACPACGNDTVTYDGLLNLVCKTCGLTQTGAFT